MLLLLHALILCTCLAAYTLVLSTPWHCHPYILQHFNGNVFFTLVSLVFLCCKYNAPCVCEPHPILLLIVIM